MKYSDYAYVMGLDLICPPAMEKAMERDYREEHDSSEAEQHHEAMRHRELDIREALDECERKGVSMETINVLLAEVGVRWKPSQQRKEP